MDGDGEDQLFDISSQAVQLDVDLLVIAIALARAVVAQVLDGTVSRTLVIVKDEAGIAQYLAVFTSDEDRGVEVELGAIGDSRVPAQADNHFAQTRRFFSQGDVAPFGQTYSHDVLPWFR